MNWPTTSGIDDEFRDHLERLAESIYHHDEAYHEEIGLAVYDTGAGRVVFDISGRTPHDMVLKVAHNDDGLRENRHEIYDRDRWDPEFRDRLVPIVESGHGDMWAIQPKVETRALSYGDRMDAKDELAELATSAGADDTREVYAENIGRHNGTFVLFDYGGL